MHVCLEFCVLENAPAMKEIAIDYKERSAIDEAKLISVLKECELKMLAKTILSELRNNSIWLMLNTDMKKCVEQLQASKILIKVCWNSC